MWELVKWSKVVRVKRRHIVILCMIISLCVVADICCAFVQEQRGVNYNIAFIEGLNLFVLSPLLWMCVGILIGSLIGMGKCVPAILRISMNILAFATILIYVCAVSMYAFRINVGWVYTVTAWCVLHSPIFTVPGFLCGLSGKRKSMYE